MSFSVAGTTITQTGVDANLSGLASISGITVYSAGGVTFYHSVNRLTITGSLSHDPEKEKLSFANTITGVSLLVSSGGTYNYGTPVTQNGYKNYSKAEGLIISRSANSNASPVFDVRGGATFNWLGGKITSYGTTFFRASAAVTIESAILTIVGAQLIRSYSSNVNIDGLEKTGGGLVFFTAPARLVGFKPIHSNWTEANRDNYAVIAYGGSANVTIENLEGFGNNSDLALIDGGNFNLKNAANGTQTSLSAWLRINSRSDGTVSYSKDVTFNVNDAADTPVSSGIVYYKDSAGVAHTEGLSAGKASFDVDLGSATMVDGVTSYNRKGSGTSDEFSFSVVGYLYNPTSISRSLQGTSTLVVGSNLVTDTSITNPDFANVSQATRVQTAQQFYDIMKKLLAGRANYKGETEPLVRREGDTIIASADITFRRNHPYSFYYYSAGKTIISIASDGFSGNIETTGIVRIDGEVTITGSIVDATANSFLRFVGIDSWTVYSTAANRAAETNPISSGAGTENYRFNYAEGTTYYLALIASGETIQEDITPAAKGETLVDLSTTSQLKVLQSQIANLGSGTGGTSTSTGGSGLTLAEIEGSQTVTDLKNTQLAILASTQTRGGN